MTRKLTRVLVKDSTDEKYTWIVLKSGVFEDNEYMRMFEEEELELLKSSLDKYFLDKKVKNMVSGKGGNDE